MISIKLVVLKFKICKNFEEIVGEIKKWREILKAKQQEHLLCNQILNLEACLSL